MSQNEYDAGDPVIVRSSKTKHKLEQELREDHLRRVVNTYEGRAVVWEFLVLCKLFEGGFAAGELAYYNQGRRDVGLEIISDIDHVAPNAYALMRDEAIERKNR